MKLKQRIGDFRVRELLAEGFVQERGDHRLYRVTKRKLTSADAARQLAAEAGVDVGDVALAGLKDKQAITIQHMTVPGGRPVKLRTRELIVEPIGFALEEMSSAASLGNAFEITVRDLERRDVATLRKNLPLVREHGVVNYFDEQRFGNLRHGQGWIARDLMKGNHEKALRALLTGVGPFEAERYRRFKESLAAKWGDWKACRGIAGKFGEHHSIFEHLAKNPEDFAGAFFHVASRVRLIHLYAYQSHVWNRAVAELVRKHVPVKQRIVVDSEEGPLVGFSGVVPAALATRRTFRLPGDRFEDVEDPEELGFLEDALAREHMVADHFHVEGVPGFQLKGEDRPLLLVPRFLRVRPAVDDALNRNRSLVKVRFELPRGAYATLVVKRLLAHGVGEANQPKGRGKGKDRNRRKGTGKTGRADRNTRRSAGKKPGQKASKPRGNR